MSEEDDVWYCAYKCVGCNYTTLDDDPDCVKCKKTGCMMAFMINQDDEGETKCDNKCGCVLGIDVPIMCWQKGDEEMTLCSECYCDAGFWKDDENPDNEDEIREHKGRIRARTRAMTRARKNVKFAA